MQVLDITDPRSHFRASERLLCYRLLLMLANRGRRLRCDAVHGFTMFPETEDGRPIPLAMDPGAVQDMEIITREARMLEPLPQQPGSSRSFAILLNDVEFVATLRVGEGDPPANYVLDLEGPPGHDREAQEIIQRFVQSDVKTDNDQWLVKGDDGAMVFVLGSPNSWLGRRGRWGLILLGAGLLVATCIACGWLWIEG